MKPLHNTSINAAYLSEHKIAHISHIAVAIMEQLHTGVFSQQLDWYNLESGSPDSSSKQGCLFT